MGQWGLINLSSKLVLATKALSEPPETLDCISSIICRCILQVQGQSGLTRVQAASQQNKLGNRASKAATSYPPPNIISRLTFRRFVQASRCCQRSASHPSVLPRSAVCLPWQALQLWSKRKASVASGECCFACGTRTKLAMQEHSCHGSSFSHFLVVTSSGAQEHLQFHSVFQDFGQRFSVTLRGQSGLARAPAFNFDQHGVSDIFNSFCCQVLGQWGLIRFCQQVGSHYEGPK